MRRVVGHVEHVAGLQGDVDDRLAESSRPTVIAQHHPPFETGMTGMDRMRLSNPDAEGAIIRKYPYVERVICGHYHRNIQARFGGTIASVCPSTAHQLLLDLVPDAGIRFTLEPSAFHLHWWNGKELVTHTQLIEVTTSAFARSSAGNIGSGLGRRPSFPTPFPRK